MELIAVLLIILIVAVCWGGDGVAALFYGYIAVVAIVVVGTVLLIGAGLLWKALPKTPDAQIPQATVQTVNKPSAAPAVAIATPEPEPAVTIPVPAVTIPVPAVVLPRVAPLGFDKDKGTVGAWTRPLSAMESSFISACLQAHADAAEFKIPPSEEVTPEQRLVIDPMVVQCVDEVNAVNHAVNTIKMGEN